MKTYTGNYANVNHSLQDNYSKHTLKQMYIYLRTYYDLSSWNKTLFFDIQYYQVRYAGNVYIFKCLLLTGKQYHDVYHVILRDS